MAKSSPSHFFKVFLPELSSDRLRIPPSFVKKHIGTIAKTHNTVSLKGPGDGVWYTDLMTNSDEVFLDSGWKDFVHDHSLQIGDFLVFKYVGSMRFDVLVFDRSACEKEAAIVARPSQNRGLNREESVVEPGDGVALKKKRGKKRKKMDSDDCVLLEGPPSPPKNKFTSRKEAQLVKDSNCSTCMKSQSIMSKKSGKSVKTSTSNLPSRVPSENSALIEYKKRLRNEGVRIGGKYRYRVISQRRPVTKEELDKVLLKAHEFKSEHPFCLTQMKDSYVYFGFAMRIPGDFGREHLPHPCGNVILLDPSGRRSEVKSIAYRQHSTFSAGWIKFSITNHLETGDVCIFEVIEKYEMKVHIFRVVEKFTPFIRGISRPKSF